MSDSPMKESLSEQTKGQTKTVLFLFKKKKAKNPLTMNYAFSGFYSQLLGYVICLLKTKVYSRKEHQICILMEMF